jgi:hypothetical protein
MLADAFSLLSMGPPMSQQRRRKQKGERKTKHTQKLQQVGTNSTSSMVS